MEIYIKIVPIESFGQCAWWNDNGSEMFLIDGDSLFTEPETTGKIYFRGTPFKNVHDARKAALNAKRQAVWDGNGNVKIEFWRFVDGKLIETKFTHDGKIKKSKEKRKCIIV